MALMYTKHEDDILKQYRENYTTGQLSIILENHGYIRSANSIRHRCHTLQLTGPVRAKLPTPGPEASLFGKVIDKVFTGQTKKRKRNKPPAPPKRERKILSLSDWHIPFHREDLIEQAVHDHRDADILVINGDFLDLYAASTFSKYKSIPILKEYNIGMEYLKRLHTIFPEIYLVRGNHEERLNRYFKSNISLEVSSIVCPEILQRMANGEVYDKNGNVTELLPFDNVHYADEHFYMLIGKTLFAHASTYSSGPGQTVERQNRYFHTLMNYDCLVTGHTHQAGQYWHNGRLLMEQGCLAEDLEYQKTSKLSYNQQNNAYAVIYQDRDGNTDKNRSRVIWCDYEPKRW
jgi:predicted phosphodiesterase